MTKENKTMTTATHTFSPVRRLGRLTALIAGACLILAAFGAVQASAAPFTLTSVDGGAFLQNGEPATQAGSHPWQASTRYVFSNYVASDGFAYPAQDLKDSVITLPAGALPNPLNIPTCSEYQLEGGAQQNEPLCPLKSQVGYINILLAGNYAAAGSLAPRAAELFNMEAPKGTGTLIGFSFIGAIYHITGKLDPLSYRPVASSLNAPQTLPMGGIEPVLWGVPAEPGHDRQRGHEGSGLSIFPCASPGTAVNCSHSAGTTPAPYFTLPTSCVGPVETNVSVTGWQGGSASGSFLSHDNTEPVPNPIGNTGCNALNFSPTLEARPTTNVADAASGLNVDIHVPQNQSPTSNVSAHLRKAEITLPEGLVINPSGANGLNACAPAQVDLASGEPANCPDASRVGSVEVNTPLLDHTVLGSVYVASPHDNPFNSLLALYISINDEQSGTIIKLPGEVKTDPATGQLTATFDENPQVPFEDFKVHIFSGANAPLRTPDVCGTYTTASSLTPWSAPDSGPPANPTDAVTISQSSSGSANCPTTSGARPNAPSFDAGTVTPIAGANSPLVVTLRRADGSQQFSSVTLTPPPGLVGKLAGIPYCSDAALTAAAAKTGAEEKASPSCPATSELGSVIAAAGAGPAPYYAPGKAYLIGPYKGAPLGVAIVTPAVAGPFDLGTIVTKAALYIDPKTAQITAVSDPIPSILQGIQLDVRSIQIKMDRPEFTRNPTSCDPMAFTGQLISTLSQPAALQNRFQLAECGRLGFEPKMSLSLTGGIKRRGHPALTATLETRPGDANIKSVSVAFPHNELLDQSHIGTVCTRVQFAASACPAGAVYGSATVNTPLLDYPLTGPVYLRSSDNTLPDLVPDLRGPATQPIKLESAGRTDSVHGGIRNSFEFVPDAPFSKLVFSLPGGNRGLIVNSSDICGQKLTATVKYVAHNGATFEQHPLLKAGCPKKKKKHHKKHHLRHAQRHAGSHRSVR